MAVGGATNTISGSIKWAGLGSETDFGAVVDELIKIESRVITKQETWKSQWQAKLDAINQLDTRLGMLKTAASDYGTRDKMLSRKATSTDEKVVTITNTSTAATGSYTVEVAEKTNEIEASRSYKEGEEIGMNYATNDNDDPVDSEGNVLGLGAWNEDSALALLSMKVPSTIDLPLSFDRENNNFLDASGNVIATRDPATNEVRDPANNRLFRLTDSDWVIETNLAAVANGLTMLGDTVATPLTYNSASGNFLDSGNNIVAKMVTTGGVSEVFKYDYGTNTITTDKLFELGSDGISTTWETDSTLAILSKKFPANLPITYDATKHEFLDSTNTVVATHDVSTNKIYDTSATPQLITTMSSHGMTNWGDPNILKFLEESQDIPTGAARPFTFDAANNRYVTSNGNIAANINLITGEITLPVSSGDPPVVLKLNDAGQLVNPKDGKPIINSDTSRHYYGPFTIEMGGKTLTLAYDPTYDPATDGIVTGKFSGKCTMEDMEKIINETVTAMGGTGPNIKAEIVFDKNRKETVPNANGGTDTVTVKHNRLRIVGLDPGVENSITISDPTNLNMDQNSVDDPLETQWIGSTAKPKLGEDAKYTGHVNKTVTFVVSAGGTLGEDEIIISWADTESKAGKFTIAPADWDSVNGCLKKDVEIEQGLTVNFNLGAGGAGDNTLRKDNAFSIDCQAPTVQKAADSGMAQSDKWVHEGFGSLTAPVNLGSGNFDFSYAGVEYSIPIRDGVTLGGLAEAINSSNKNPGVIASVLNDGMGTATSYKLVLTGAHSGSEHEIRVLPTSKISNLNMKPENFDHARVATNSMCRIDGYPSDGISWIQRPSNEVSDVLDGTVLQLQSSGKATVNIVNDVTAMADKVKQIVEAINYAMGYIQEQSRYAGGKLTIKVLKDGTIQRGTEGEASGVMNGNYGFQISNSEIKKIMSSQIFTMDEYLKAKDPKNDLNYGALPYEEREDMYEAFLEENGLIYTRLSDIGIAFNATASTDYSKNDASGAYVIEESKLNEALRKNPEAVIKLLTFKPDENSDIPQYTKYADEQPRPFLSGGVLSKLFYSMSDLTRSSDVYDKNTGEMVQSAKGIMRVLSENYSNIISGIDEKIAREEKRIGLKQERLEEKFARLDTMLAKLNQQSKSVEAELKKLAG